MRTMIMPYTRLLRILGPFLFLLWITTNVFGQKDAPVVRIPIGQISQLNFLTFSGDGKLMASGSADNSVIIWNAQTGADIRKINTGHPVKRIIFAGDGSYLFTISGLQGAESSGNKTLMKWDTRTGALLGKYSFSGSLYVGYVPSIDKLVLTEDSDQMQKLYQQATNKDVNKVPQNTDIKEEPPGMDEGEIEQLAQDYVNKKITKEEYMKRVQEGMMKKVVNPYQKVNVLLDAGSLTKKIRLGKSFDELYSIQYEGKEYLLGMVLNLMAKRGESRYSIEAWPVSDLLAGNAPATGTLPWKSFAVDNQSSPIHISPGNGFFALKTRNKDLRSIQLWHLGSSAPVANLEISGSEFSEIEFSRNGDFIFAYSFKFGGTRPEYFVEGWNTKTLKREIFFRLHNGYYAGIFSAFPSGDQFAAVTAFPSWQIRKINPDGDSAGVFGGRSSAPSYFGFSEGDKEVYTNFYGNPDMEEFLTVMTTAIVENEAFNKGIKLSMEQRNEEVKKKLATANFGDRPDGYNLSWDLERGGAKRTEASGFSGDHRLLSADKDYLLQNEMYETGVRIPNASYVQMVRPPEKGLSPDIARKMREYFDTANLVYKFLYAGNRNGPVTKLINRKTKDTVSLIKIDSTDWVMVLQSGYYMSSRNGAKALNYVSGYSVYPFEQFDLQYNRPDKILQAIGKSDPSLIDAYRKAWLKRMKRAKIDTTQFGKGHEVPVAEISNRQVIDQKQTQGKLKLEIHAKDVNHKLDRYNIWINEVPVFGKNGRSIRHLDVLEFNTKVDVDLSEGENHIEVSVLNNAGIESYRIPLLVNYTPASKAKGSVHFIGIGIDQFADAKYNLQYSSKDIRDLARKLQERYKGNIVIDTLFNERVTLAAVKALKEKLKQTSVNDKVIVSYSGHGMLNKEFDYYLSTYTVNFDKPEENGLPYDELENLLDSIPARRKLLLIDACHSGEVDKEDLVVLNKAPDSLIKGLKPIAYKQEGHLGLRNSFELMQSLFVNVGKSTGAIIISAAAGTQFALERNDLKNGVFTFSILEAMKKKASIRISELKKTVGERVEALTRGQQQPTSRNETIAVDWEL